MIFLKATARALNSGRDYFCSLTGWAMLASDFSSAILSAPVIPPATGRPMKAGDAINLWIFKPFNLDFVVGSDPFEFRIDVANRAPLRRSTGEDRWQQKAFRKSIA
jgi:hypothetical protein